MQKLVRYFTNGIVSQTLQTIGAEVETQFVDSDGNAIQTVVSQQMLKYLAVNGWVVECRKGDMITALVDRMGNRLFYELGRHNIEVSTAATTLDRVLGVTMSCLDQVYIAANKFGAKPYFEPVLDTNEDLLVIPDERDATWLELDGRSALASLARTSSVQFTFSVAPGCAIRILNSFGLNINSFLADYPQDAIWKNYIADSSAGYLANRYGGPLTYETLGDYCRALACHNVVQGPRLVPFETVSNLDIPLFLRSIWWYFRLKRYNNDLCIEVRPMPRLADEQIKNQLSMVLDIVRA